MKNYIILLTFILASCSTLKVEEQIVQDLTRGNEVANYQKKYPWCLIEDPYSSADILDCYEMARADKELPYDETRIISLPKNFSNWPMDKEEIDKIRKRHQKDDQNFKWDSIQFKNLKMPIISRKDFLSKTKNDLINVNTIGHVISKPILSLNKKCALVKYNYITLGGGTSIKTLLMEKVDGKWVIKLKMSYNDDLDPALRSRETSSPR